MNGPFWNKVQVGDPEACWPWKGYTKPSGHGLTTLNSLMIHASRKAWILTHGPIRNGLCVNHTCDNPACCNPGHMYLGTRADNMIDRFARQLPREARPHRTVLNDAQLEQLWQMRRQGALLRECAAHFGVHIATVVRYVAAKRREKLERNRRDRLARVSQSEYKIR